MIPQLHVRILTYDIRRIDRTWGTREHCDPYWRLYVNQRDGAHLDVSGGRYPLTADRLHLVPAWVPLRCGCRRSLRHFFVHFDLIGLSGQVVRDVFDRPRCLRRKAPYERTVSPLTPARDGSDGPDLAVTMYVKSLVVDAMRDLLLLLPRAQRDRFRQLAAGSHHFSDLVQYIDRHLADRLDNRRLARIAHMSRSHFIRCFGQAVGQTPAAYVLERRIAAAAERLSFFDDSIERIAGDTGFANRFYFSRVFGRLMGIPPAGYRKAIR